MAAKGKTGPFPKSPKDILDFETAQIEAQKTFKNAKRPAKAFGGYSANIATDPDKGPYGRRVVSEMGGKYEGNNVQNVNDGTMDVPKKSRDHMTETLPFTKVPRGLYHPVRGEGPAGNSNQ